MKKFKVTVDGRPFTVTVEEVNEPDLRGSLSQPSGETTVRRESIPAPAPEMPVKEQAVSGEGAPVKAPMPGSIIEVRVAEGDRVNTGDILVILEAMKMENEVTASRAGTIDRVSVKKGDTVNSGDPLLFIV